MRAGMVCRSGKLNEREEGAVSRWHTFVASLFQLV